MRSSRSPVADVVHLTTVHPATDSRIFEKECRTLTDQGLNVHIIARSPIPDAGSITIHTLPNPRNRLARILTLGARSVILTRRLAPRIVHLHDPEMIPWIPILRILRFQVVFDAHEDIPSILAEKHYLKIVNKKTAFLIGRILVLIAANASNRVIAATPYIANRYHKNKTHVVQNFPDLSLWQTPRNEDPHPRMVFVGNPTRERGAFVMLDALAALLPQMPQLTLDIVGPMDPELRTRLEAHPAWPNVNVRGRLTRAGVTDALSRAWIGLAIFEPRPNAITGQPTKLYEYMIAGLPIVASDFPRWKKLLEDNECGTTVSPNDIAGISKSILSLLDDSALRQHLGSNGRRYVEERCNWQIERQCLLEAYGHLLASDPKQKDGAAADESDRIARGVPLA